MATTITLGNTKGGVGKTTVTNFLAAHLAEKGKKVLMLDTDPQANLTQVIERKYGTPENKITFFEALQKNDLKSAVINLDENLYYIPSKRNFVNVTSLMKGRYNYLKKKLKEIESDYDFILFDVSPYPYAESTLLALGASDFFLVVTSVEKMSLEGIKDFYEMGEKASESNPSIEFLGSLINIRDNDKDTYKQLDKEYNFSDKEQFFETSIPRRTRIGKFNEYGIYNFGKLANNKPDKWEVEVREIGEKLVSELFVKLEAFKNED